MITTAGTVPEQIKKCGENKNNYQLPIDFFLPYLLFASITVVIEQRWHHHEH